MMQTNGSTRNVIRVGIACLVLLALVLGTTGCGAFDRADETVAPEDQRYGGIDGAQSGDTAVDGDVLTGEAMVAEEMVDPGAPPLPDGAGADASLVPEEDRLVIRNKSVRLEVEDVRSTVDEIRSLAAAHGAIVTNVNVASDDDRVYRYDYEYAEGGSQALSGYVTVRVPSEDFAAFVDEADDLGEVLWEYESIDDVTQQHVDLSARLENEQAEEARLREFFDAAVNVEEMLQIEQELARVRANIESMQAQIAFLERQAAMATVTIELLEPEPVVRPEGPDWGFVRAFTAGLQAAAAVIQALIFLGIGALPLLAIAAVVLLIVRYVLRRRRRKREAAESAS